ncbi:RNA-directed DNA polymerase [Rhizobium leguminosarum]|uniref:RNA-directed DNA polymerase n=1 Tax=Rhizobium leguminosarum TaxID=384 RepID=UPI001C950028|nr:RNA-directed DNA polymerase [Rhizobium leguminosarum]MBY5769584.1 RNA-directed DNA polymerase [Rhizobium leguminosarum]
MVMIPMSYCYSEFLQNLASKGYFPLELPPTFTTKSFGENISAILSDWMSSGVVKKDAISIRKKLKARGNYTYQIDDTESEVLTKPKRGFERRGLHIAHPIPQSLLAEEIARNWPEIATWISKKRYSMDRTEPTDKGDRAISDINFLLHGIKKDFILSGADWILKTDITRFYPSIYTHSVAWAAYGKSRTKNLLYTKRHAGSLADRIDLLLRKSNMNQTVGIPVGPDTSRIVADIISSRIDDDFHQLMERSNGHVAAGRNDRLLKPAQIDRLQDDWFIGAQSLEMAEQALSWLSIAYRAYGLEINGAKTSVDRILNQEKETWASELALHLQSTRGRLTGANLKGFLDRVVHLQAQYKSSPVVSFAVSSLEAFSPADADVPLLESFYILAASIAPGHMDRVCTALVNLQHTKKALSKDRIRDRFVTLAEQHVELGNGFEAIWLLHTLRGLRIKFASKKLAELSENYQGATLPLMLLDMKVKGVFCSGLPTGVWETAITADTIRHDWTWLLGYEAFRRGWLQDTNGLLADPLFVPLANRGVVFYDDTKNVKTTASLRRKRVAKRKTSNRLATVLLAQLATRVAPLGIDEDEYRF